MVSTKFSHRAKISYQCMATDCEILVLDVTLPDCSPFSFVNVYFPAGVQDTRCLDVMLASCRKDILLTGDFNSHHVSWGFRTDLSGRRLWEWAVDNNLSCLNSHAATFVRGQSKSAIDLTFSSSSLSISSWNTLDCATNSDHLPITFDINFPRICSTEKVGSFVNYVKLQKDLKATLIARKDMQEDIRAMSLCAVLKRSLKNSSFKLNSGTGGSFSPWWNAECMRAYRKQKAAWKQLLVNQCPKNWSDYKFIAADFKRTIRKAKDDYDINKFNYLSRAKNKKSAF